jgi:hypothetical protein
MQPTSSKIQVELLAKFIEKMEKSDELVGKIRKSRDVHPGGRRYASESKEMVTDKQVLSAESAFSLEDVINYNSGCFSAELVKLGETHLGNVKRMLFDGLNQMTAFTGNEVNGEGQPLTAEKMLEAIEKTQIFFDKEGNPKLPTITPGDPKMAKKIKEISESAEFQKKLAELIETKKQEYYASKRYRRLPRVD